MIELYKTLNLKEVLDAKIETNHSRQTQICQ
jgi:hypothetical protein